MFKTNEYLTSLDGVGQFINKTYDITNSDKDRVKSSDIYIWILSKADFVVKHLFHMINLMNK
jgi:flavoprotein